MTNIQTDNDHRNFKQSFFDASMNFHRHAQNIGDVASLLYEQIELSKSKGWRSVSLQYEKASACVSILRNSQLEMTEVFDDVKGSSKLAEVNRATMEKEVLSSMRIVFRNFVDGSVSKEDLSSTIKKVFGVPQSK